MSSPAYFLLSYRGICQAAGCASQVFSLRRLSLPLFLGAAILQSCSGSSSTTATCDALPPPRLKELASYRLAFAQVGTEGANPLRLAQTYSMTDATAKLGLSLTAYDAGGDADTQINQINTIVAAQYDALFVIPVDSTVAPAIIAARAACIPVFLIDQNLEGTAAVAGVDYVTFIGPDHVAEGTLIGNWLLSHTTGPLTILELLGPSGASSAQDRQQGFETTVLGQARASVIAELADNNERAAARASVTSLLQNNGSVNVVAAFNDQMGLGALDSLTDARNVSFLFGSKPGQQITMLSADGARNVVNEIIAGRYNATVTSTPQIGPLAIAAWENYLRAQTQLTWLKTDASLIDETNAPTSLVTAF